MGTELMVIKDEEHISHVRGIIVSDIINPDDLSGIKRGEVVAVMQRFRVPMTGFISHMSTGIFDGKNISRDFYVIENFPDRDGNRELRRVKYSFSFEEQSFLGHGYVYSKPVGRLKERTCRARFERINGGND